MNNPDFDLCDPSRLRIENARLRLALRDEAEAANYYAQRAFDEQKRRLDAEREITVAADRYDELDALYRAMVPGPPRPAKPASDMAVGWRP